MVCAVLGASFIATLFVSSIFKPSGGMALSFSALRRRLADGSIALVRSPDIIACSRAAPDTLRATLEVLQV
jgi:hypothetical protein